MCAAAFPHDAYAQFATRSQKAGEQRKAEKGLSDNRYFIYYINASVTNYGTDEDKKLFAEIIRRDILAQFFYMKFEFTQAYAEIVKVQILLVKLYKSILAQDTASVRENA